jgi:hypothetical protein
MYQANLGNDGGVHCGAQPRHCNLWFQTGVSLSLCLSSPCLLVSLLWADQVSGNVMVSSQYIYVAAEGLWTYIGQYLLFICSYPLLSFWFCFLCSVGLGPLFHVACMLSDLKSLSPYYQAISQFFSGWFKFKVWRSLQYSWRYYFCFRKS